MMMEKAKIFTKPWFDMVQQKNEQAELNLPPTIKDICLNIVITDELLLDNEKTEPQAGEKTQLYLLEGRLYQGLHAEAKSQVQLTYKTMKSLLTDISMDNTMQAFIRGDILVTGDVSQLMALQMAKVTDEQKLLFTTILENTDLENTDTDTK